MHLIVQCLCYVRADRSKPGARHRNSQRRFPHTVRGLICLRSPSLSSLPSGPICGLACAPHGLRAILRGQRALVRPGAPCCDKRNQPPYHHIKLVTLVEVAQRPSHGKTNIREPVLVPGKPATGNVRSMQSHSTTGSNAEVSVVCYP